MKTQVWTSIRQWREFRKGLPADTSVGFVPTMGALHEGHASLMNRAAQENTLCVVSVFVNPTQFDDPSDLQAYPRTWEADLALMEGLGIQHVLLPNAAELYPDDFRYRVSENEISSRLCGEHRPGHFDGVLTVVLKLLQLVRADRAYFGEKDFQQLELVRGMAEAFFLDTEIVPCPIVREADGLAMSSRNTRLSPEHREKAAAFAGMLRESAQTGASSEEVRSALEGAGFDVDYVSDWAGRRLAAIRLGEVRLIDNVPTGDGA